MTDLESLWEDIIAEAAKTGLAEGHFADFISVKTTNDKIRANATDQLLGAFEKIAGHLNRSASMISVEVRDRHRFEFENAKVSGRSLAFRQGVRCLTVEAGWTRTPNDGFMKGNALAVARVSHFGIPTAGADLKLLKFDGKIGWFRIERDGMRVSVEIEDIVRHFRMLTGQ